VESPPEGFEGVVNPLPKLSVGAEFSFIGPVDYVWSDFRNFGITN
jgi:hypothetical protein